MKFIKRLLNILKQTDFAEYDAWIKGDYSL